MDISRRMPEPQHHADKSRATTATDARIRSHLTTLLVVDRAVQTQKKRRQFEPQVPHRPEKVKKSKKLSSSATKYRTEPHTTVVACSRLSAAQASRALPPPTVNRKRHAQEQEAKHLRNIARLLKRERSAAK